MVIFNTKHKTRRNWWNDHMQFSLRRPGSLRADAFPGTASASEEKTTLRGLRTRAVLSRSHRPPLTRTSGWYNVFFYNKLLFHLMVHKHNTSGGNTCRLLRQSEDDETPHEVGFFRGGSSRARGKRS